MIQVTRHNGMTTIDGEDKNGERNFAASYIDDMYNSWDGFGIQHNKFGKPEEKRILEITDQIHKLVRELDNIKG